MYFLHVQARSSSQGDDTKELLAASQQAATAGSAGADGSGGGDEAQRTPLPAMRVFANPMFASTLKRVGAAR